MSNDQCEDILIDENKGIALVEIPALTKYEKQYQLELHDFQRVSYQKDYNNDCLLIEFTESQLNLICEAWAAYQSQAKE